MKNRPGRDSAARSLPVRCGVGSFSMSVILEPRHNKIPGDLRRGLSKETDDLAPC